MTVSRRQFITAGLAAAAVSSVPALTSPAAAAGAPSSKLFSSSANFKPHVGSKFTIFLAGGKSRTMTLRSVTDFRLPAKATSSASRDCTGPGFTLTFDGSSIRGVPQGSYTVKHARLGAFQLFVTPVGRATDYEAVINRVS